MSSNDVIKYKKDKIKYSFRWEYNIKQKYINIKYIKPEDLLTFDFSDKNFTELFIDGDYLEELIVPNGVETVVVNNLALRKLTLPDTVEFLYCENNCLKELELPSNIYKVDAHNNYIQQVTFKDSPKQLMYLNLENNRLLDFNFDIPKTLTYLNIDGNKNINIPPRMRVFINEHSTREFEMIMEK